MDVTRWGKALFVVSAFSAFAAQAADYDDRFYAAPFGSYVLADDSRFSDDGYGGGFAIGKPVSPHVSVEIRGQYLKYDGNSQELSLLSGLGCLLTPNSEACAGRGDYELGAGGVGANYYFAHNTSGPYAHVDALYGDDWLYNAGLGWDFGVRKVALRAEALYHYDATGRDFEEVQFNLGLRIPFGKRSEALVEPAPAPVAPEVAVVPAVQPAYTPAPAYQPPVPPSPPCAWPAPGQPLTLDGCRPGDVFVLHGVNFEFDKARLTVNAQTLLDGVVTALNNRPELLIEIDGHTDSKGADDYNQKLSDQRARAVLSYLVTHGVAANRLTARGFGEAHPVADNNTDEGRERNRRVELKVLGTR